jgi:hypothetical protein
VLAEAADIVGYAYEVEVVAPDPGPPLRELQAWMADNLLRDLRVSTRSPSASSAAVHAEGT